MTGNLPRPDLAGVDALLTEYAPSRAERDALSALLERAAAPAGRGELRGEAVALAAFRAAVPVRTAGPSLQVRLARALSIKAAVAALTLAGMGGVAVAASTGSLPGPIDGFSNSPASPETPTGPATVPDPAPAAGQNGSGTGSDTGSVPPPGLAVADSTRGAEQSELVRERNAQRQQELRDERLAEREARLARIEERRRQAAVKPGLTQRQDLPPTAPTAPTAVPAPVVPPTAAQQERDRGAEQAAEQALEQPLAQAKLQSERNAANASR